MNSIDNHQAEAIFHIGDIPIYGDVVLAPMDGVSDHPFRLICRRMGSAFIVTEFINVMDVPNKLNNLDQRTFFVEEERPLGIQLYGIQPRDFVQSALALLPQHPDFFDINLGCSVRRVSGRGAGAGLLTQPQVVAEIFRLLTKEIPLPITGKIRLGWDMESRNYMQIADILQENGAAAISVHGRTRSQNWASPSTWAPIREVKQRLSIPVIGNGDVKTTADIQRMLDETGCDAVMIGRAALGNPWLFSRIDKADVVQEEILRMIETHWKATGDFFGIDKASYVFRKHLKAYLTCPQFAQLDYKPILTSPDPIKALREVI
jgi:nifR3 family TIM-barrel protein